MKLRFASLATCLALTCSTASAANLGFLGQAPISRMTAEDVDLMYQAAVDALDNTPDGGRRGWENPSTSASGTMMPLATYTGPDGMTCRTIRVLSHAAGLKNQSVFDLCKQPDGRWKAMNK